MNQNIGNFQWLVSLVRPGTELATEDRLIGLDGVDAFVPYRTIVRTWKDRKVIRKEALMPGYVFAYADLEERGQLVKAGGVERLLRFGTEYATLQSSEVLSLRRMSETDPNPETWEQPEGGVPIRVLAGPFAGCVGEVVERHQHRYFTVRLPMLGRQVAVKMQLIAGEVTVLPKIGATGDSGGL